MSSIYAVPAPINEDAQFEEAIRALRAVAAELHADAQRLGAAGQRAVHGWEAESAHPFQVGVAREQGELGHLAAGYESIIEMANRYLSVTQQARQQALAMQSAILEHAAEYHRRAVAAVAALHGRAQAKFGEAKRHAEQAVEDINVLHGHFNPVAAVGDTTAAVGSAFEGIADEAVASFLDQLQGWQPRTISPHVLSLRPGLDKVEKLTESMVLSELAAIGDVLATVLLEEFADLLWAMGLHDAVRAVRTVEDDFAAEAAASFAIAVEAYWEISVTAAQLAGRMLSDMAVALDGAGQWIHQNVTGTAIPTIAGWMAGLLLGGDDATGRRLDPTIANRLDYEAVTNLYTKPGQQRFRDMRDLSTDAIYENPPGVSGDWAPSGPPEFGPNDGVAQLYYNNRTHEYALIFRGSVPGDEAMWQEDGLNAAGVETPMGDWAVEMATKYHHQVVDQGGQLEYGGHSLGGRLAATASIATGDPATTFNAAGIGDQNYDRAVEAHGGPPADESHIVNYGTDTDPVVTGPQDKGVPLLGKAGREASGAQVTIISNVHGMDGHGGGAFPQGTHTPDPSDSYAGPVR